MAQQPIVKVVKVYRVGWQTRTDFRPYKGKKSSVVCGEHVSASATKQFDVNENRCVWFFPPPTKTCQASLSFMKMSSVTVTLRSSWVKFGVDLRVAAVERFVSS